VPQAKHVQTRGREQQKKRKENNCRMSKDAENRSSTWKYNSISISSDYIYCF